MVQPMDCKVYLESETKSRRAVNGIASKLRAISGASARREDLH